MLQGFAGADYSNAGRSAAGPVQFEREPGGEEDMFGLDKFMTEMRSGASRKEKKGALDHIGGGSMRAGGAGGSYEDYAGGSNRKMEFSQGRG